MSENILFVFEGEKTEKVITNSMLSFFIQDEGRTVVRTAYKSNIYSLYNKMKKDEFLDIFELIKESNENLKDFTRDRFSQVYLFFDYDGHDPQASDQIVSDMIGFFNEETEKGKLFISYPMVESLKCIKDINDCNEFYSLEFEVCNFKGYKEFVHGYSDNNISNFTSYTKEKWGKVIKAHLSKGNLIVHGQKELPKLAVLQNDIFDKQKTDFLDTKQSVSVLGAFPLMILEYYGIERTLSLL